MVDKQKVVKTKLARIRACLGRFIGLPFPLVLLIRRRCLPAFTKEIARLSPIPVKSRMGTYAIGSGALLQNSTGSDSLEGMCLADARRLGRLGATVRRGRVDSVMPP